MAEIKFAPREIFEIGLKWFVMPAFDLILEYRDGIILVRRKIPPYKNQWALPGLRFYKGEEIADALKRVAKQEVGLVIDPKEARLIGQYNGKFRTEMGRQDLSTSYHIKVQDSQEIRLNRDHFSGCRIITDSESLPGNIGAMYRYHIELYRKLRRSP